MSYDEELIGYLKGIHYVIVKEDERYFDLVESKFPFGFSTINWSEVEDFMHKEISLYNNKEKAKEDTILFLNLAKEKGSIDNKQTVIILSDGSLENTYSLKWSDFVKHFEEIIFLPQHTYIIPEDGKWCLNYTFENDLFFGFSSKK